MIAFWRNGYADAINGYKAFAPLPARYRAAYLRGYEAGEAKIEQDYQDTLQMEMSNAIYLNEEGEYYID